jgi:hypothetical protein
MAQPEALHRARTEILHQHVRLRSQFGQHFPARVALDVDRQRALAAVARHEECGEFTRRIDQRPASARAVAADRLDLQNIRALIARNIVAYGPDTTAVRSRTRTPLRGPDIGFFPIVKDLSTDVPGAKAPVTSPVKQTFVLQRQAVRQSIPRHHAVDPCRRTFPCRQKGRRAECAAIDGVRRDLDQFLLHVVLLRTRNQFVDIDARRNERLAKGFDVVHLLRLFPHVMVGRAEIWLEHAFELCRPCAAHQHQGVDRKKRIRLEFGDVVPADEALGFKRIVLRLVLDAAEQSKGDMLLVAL